LGVFTVPTINTVPFDACLLITSRLASLARAI
jgi:hypothetical protein